MSQICWRAPNALYVGEVLDVFFSFAESTRGLYILPLHMKRLSIVQAVEPNMTFSAKSFTFPRTIFGHPLSH